MWIVNKVCDEYLFFFTLQYCIGFAIHQHESTTGIHMFPILNPPFSSSLYHPSGSSQCTSPKHPISCIEPGLAIHFLYDIIHVSMLFSQIIPTPPSPTESKRLFYTSVSLSLSCIWGFLNCSIYIQFLLTLLLQITLIFSYLDQNLMALLPF